MQVHFIIAACENMIDGRGMRPGDILTAMNGLTVEVRALYLYRHTLPWPLGHPSNVLAFRLPCPIDCPAGISSACLHVSASVWHLLISTNQLEHVPDNEKPEMHRI